MSKVGIKVVMMMSIDVDGGGDVCVLDGKGVVFLVLDLYDCRGIGKKGGWVRQGYGDNWFMVCDGGLVEG